MKKIIIFFVLLMVAGSALKAQSLGFQMGLGLGLDMGVSIDEHLPPLYTMKYKNAALPTVNVFTRFTIKKFHISPDFKLSFGTFGRGSRTAINSAGFHIPEGENLSLLNEANLTETIDRTTYLMDDARVTTSTMSVGLFASWQIYETKLGGPEIGTGAFYLRKELYFKEYNGHDVYDYVGSSGDHVTQVQTNHYVFNETKRDKNPIHTIRVSQNMIEIPVRVQYNFHTQTLVDICPSFTAYFGHEIYYNLGISVAFGNMLKTSNQ